MKLLRILFDCMYALCIPPVIYLFFMVLCAEFAVKIQAFAIIAALGAAGTFLLHLMNKEHSITGGVQIIAAIGDIILLCGVVMTVVQSLEQQISLFNLISGYFVMAAFIGLRVWDFIYIDKCLAKAEKERLEQSDENK